jgi:hypothetical protein
MRRADFSVLHRARLALTLCVALAIAPSSWAKPPDIPPYIDNAVTALVAQFSDGMAVSYPEFRYIVRGKVFDSGGKDAVAFFSIEGFHGGNYHAEYMALFAAVPPEGAGADKNAHPFRLVAVAQIGGRGERTFRWKTARLRPNEITVSGLRWGKNDPGCCASRPIKVTFRVVNGNIVEVK